MSAAKGRKQEGTFHILYPARRDFWTWTEIGCLARTLGFPTDLFRHNVNEEVETEEEGMYVQQLQRMIELKLLNQALHRSFNMHTSDWNLCVIRKALHLLGLSVLSFEEVHNIRVAYATYEAADMKGLALDQRTLLRTLKMCHRVISPKKLMHRVKHMKSRLEEANRIQLYEFFDLVLWCDYMEHNHATDKFGEAEGKEKDLYNLVDFESLLSHQDQRRSRALDKRYLAEEWDFGREQLGSKHMFKGEVVYTDQRIKQTRAQKKNYRGLKRAVSQSQRRVYRAHAGSIRNRPISAPDLSMYSTPRGTPRARTTSAAAMYQSVQRRFHSANSREANSRLDLSDRPALPEYVRAHTPSVVTSQDLDEASLKMQMLQFDIITLETRCQVKKEEEMNFYIPEYHPPATEDNSDRAEKEVKRAEHWTPDIIDSLAYPPYHLPRFHAHTCDARFRGWKPSDQQGRQKILTAPTFDSSPNGQLFARQRSALLGPVKDLHKDYVVRYTSRKEASEQQRAKRPCTAPAASPRAKPLKRLGCRSAGHPSRRGDSEDSTTALKTADDIVDEIHRDDDFINEDSAETTSKAVKSYPDPYGKYSQEHSRNFDSEGGDAQIKDSGHQGSSSAASDGQAPGRHYSCGDAASRVGAGSSGAKDEKTLPLVPPKNGPSRRSKVVDMGLIGTITLLESIQEHETEDRLNSTLSTTSSRPSSSEQRPTAPPGPGRYQENLDQSSKSIPAGWSRRPQTPEIRNDHVAPNMNSLGAGEGQRTENAVPAQVDQASKDVPPGYYSSGQVDAGFQNPRDRFPQPNTVASRQDKQNLDQSSRARGELPPKAEQRQNAELRKPRVNSAESSAMSEGSDHAEAPTPLTSVTVTIKNKDQHVSRTRLINDVEGRPDVMEGNVPSPLGFKRSSPCITSTPRRKRTPPIHTPKSKQSGHTNPTTLKSSQANHSSNLNPTSDTVNSPDIAGKGLGKKALSLLQSETDPDSRLSWIQDQILAMNSAREKMPQEEETEKKSDRDVTEAHDEHPPNEDEAEGGEEEGKKTTIRFSKEHAFHERREAAYQQYMQRRKASEGALKLKSYDLNAETSRRFIFNRATTRRLLHRVQDVISPELRNRIRSGDTGLRVI